MTEIQLRSDFDVELVDFYGDDALICQAARVSTLGEAAADSESSAGLIGYLMKNRHGSPFEHGAITFRISAPIFVWREFMRHRIGFSYNEQSGRYMELAPVFYYPGVNGRPLRQVGKAGHYTFVEGEVSDNQLVEVHCYSAYSTAWGSYKSMLDADIAKEVARIVLPVATYSTAYVTCNPRSLMSFLSLRTKHEDSKFPSYPQWEINQVADAMEAKFAQMWPLTHAAFHSAGRVSP